MTPPRNGGLSQQREGTKKERFQQTMRKQRTTPRNQAKQQTKQGNKQGEGKRKTETGKRE
jgi:hypothetical protein